MSPRLIQAALGGLLIIGVLGGAALGVESCGRGKAQQAQQTSDINTGEANVHADTAAKVPDHARELQSAQDDVARARAEVARVSRLLEAYQEHAVPDQPGPGAPVAPALDPDPRDVVIASQGVLIEKLDGQVVQLQLALTDEQKRSNEFKAAFEAERRRALAQEAATEAWKQAVTASKWRGRFEGFAVGVVAGYLGGRR